jgi:hypothetical protein
LSDLGRLGLGVAQLLVAVIPGDILVLLPAADGRLRTRSVGKLLGERLGVAYVEGCERTSRRERGFIVDCSALTVTELEDAEVSLVS